VAGLTLRAKSHDFARLVAIRRGLLGDFSRSHSGRNGQSPFRGVL
jgi:hypothetical protein